MGNTLLGLAIPNSLASKGKAKLQNSFNEIIMTGDLP
jgi:hypothetical protein